MNLSNLQSKMKNNEKEHSLLDSNSGKILIKAKKEKPTPPCLKFYREMIFN